MNLQVGLTHDVPAWRLLLDQEKIPYQIISGGVGDQLDRTKFPVILLTGVVISKDLLSRYLKNGGVVVADQASKKLIERIEDKERTIILNVDIKLMVENQKSCKKRFVFRNEHLIEEVAAVQKSQARRELVSAMKHAFWMSGLPYVHLWYFPDGLDNVFAFRIDFDEYDAREFYQMCTEIKPYASAVSAFICMRTYEKLENELEHLSSLGIEIGSHGYIHHVYQSYQQNNWNLEQAEQLLRRYVERIKGFCAPHGLWNPSLQRVLEERGYEYSSEFGLNYDDFPFFPISNGRVCPLLQIPVHPISEGVFDLNHDGEKKAAAITSYFEAVIDHKAQMNEPIFLYGHPTGILGRYPSIFRGIIQRIKKMNHVSLTHFNLFAQWWKLRHNVQIEIEYVNGVLKGVLSPPDRRLMLDVHTPNGRRALLPLDSLVMGKSLQNPVISAETKDEFAPPQYEIQESPVHYSGLKWLKRWLKNEIDWEIKTPLSMIQVLDLRSLIKYVMRLGYYLSKGIKIFG